jgi:hypothetical protein
MTCLFLVAFTLVIVWNGKSAISQEGVLDGKTFVGEVGEKGKKNGDKDTFTFKDGKFHSKACDPYGFGDGVYTATVNGDTTTIQVETVSAKEGKMEWTGTVKGDTFDGTLTWHKGNKAPKEYWFKGESKK